MVSLHYKNLPNRQNLIFLTWDRLLVYYLHKLKVNAVMKTLISLTIVAVLFSTPLLGRESDDSLKVLSTKRSVLYFKVSKDLLGATIQIENEEHDLIESIPVDQKKMIVDFFYLAPGAYTIKIKKDNVEYAIDYFNE